jgi:hypothetical protein
MAEFSPDIPRKCLTSPHLTRSHEVKREGIAIMSVISSWIMVN